MNVEILPLDGNTWAHIIASRTGSLVFINDVAAYKSNRMNSKVYRAVLCAQIQPTAT